MPPALWRRSRRLIARGRRAPAFRFLRLLLPVLVLLPLTASSAWAPGILRVDFIDVGQGDAALVTSPAGKTVLIDGGPHRSSAALTRFLAAHLHRPPLDLIVLSHRHEDHVGGLPAVVDRIGTRLFLDAPPVQHSGPSYAALMRALESRGVAVREATRGRKIDLGAGAVMTLIGPPEPAISGSRSDVNANSVVARLTYAGVSMLFVGDAEAPTEAWLLDSGAVLHASVLKVAHHGSRFASGARFLRAVGPGVAIVSVGEGNSYRHPAAQTLARLARGGASVYRTDVDGDVSIETDGRAIEIHSAHGRAESQKVP